MSFKNDNLKRHVESVQNDIHRQSGVLLDVFINKTEKAFFSYTIKIEKIVSAIYLITDIMDGTLPLTNSLRGESLELLNACYRLLSSGVSMTPVEVSRIVVRLEHVISLVQIGRIAHHISDMNADIILRELTRVLELILGEVKVLQDQYANYSTHGKGTQPVISHAILDDAIFDKTSHERKVIHTTSRFIRPVNFNSQVSHEKPVNDIKTTFSLTTPLNDNKDNVVYNEDDKTHKTNKTTFKTTRVKLSSGKDRKQEILSVIKSHKDATMHDIQRFISDCSEKTIQREIVQLIKVGLITKQGDKRWATYHLV